jgi:HD superfamily phosphohydrolase YqeK
MKKIYKEIWRRALKYQDKRDDKGHAQITLKFAQELLKGEKVNQDIVIPAIILHDIGWSQLPLKERFLIFQPNATKEQEYKMRFKHQKEGCKLATKILKDVDYDKSLSRKILKIISQHDTNEKKLSKEDAVVKDADKLWRFSKKGFWTDVKRRKITPLKRYEDLKAFINQKDSLFTLSAMRIAIKELEQRRQLPSPFNQS